MNQFEKQKIEQSIKDFKKSIENTYTEISFLEKKKIEKFNNIPLKGITFGFTDWNKKINSKIKYNESMIDYFNEKISQSNKILLILNTKKEPAFLKKVINSIDNKMEKSKSIKTTKERKIKTEIFL
ncbi:MULTISPECIES: hypothetical protein [unclassified Spiroplasma]|uniref:hypothetical protein n=1 Tax=unclassified Spiroplasma TaxID=2637901 RepID=UPI002079A258|nr:hypothetical protein [Spiroplasma endosymbiont of Lariophagus distinguendus]